MTPQISAAIITIVLNTIQLVLSNLLLSMEVNDLYDISDILAVFVV